MGYFRKSDLHGQVFGLLTVLEYAGLMGPHAAWLCACACGNTKKIRGNHLKRSITKSCGCLSTISSRKRCTLNNKKHGESKGVPEYKIWCAMNERCHNKNNKAYKHYGERGITVCERWRKYENFIADMGRRPDGYTLERIDVNKDYGPDNCRWDTRHAQARNTSRTILITYQDKTQCAQDWSLELGHKSKEAISRRLRRGWPLERAMTP